MELWNIVCKLDHPRVDSICHTRACVHGFFHFGSTAILTVASIRIESLLHKRGQSYSYIKVQMFSQALGDVIWYHVDGL